MGEPPSLAGALQVNMSCVSLLPALSLYRLVGKSGTVGATGMVAPLPSLELEESPMAFVASTLAVTGSLTSRSNGDALNCEYGIVHYLLSLIVVSLPTQLLSSANEPSFFLTKIV